MTPKTPTTATSLARTLTPTLRAGIALALVALLFVPALGAAQGKGPPDGTVPANETPGQRQGESQGRDEGADGAPARNNTSAGPPEDRGMGSDAPGRPGQQDRGHPVFVEDHPGGFRTEAPPQSRRPTVDVNVSEGRATVARSDVASLTLHVDAVIEYVDENDNGAYDVGEEVLSRESLRASPPQVQVDQDARTRDAAYALERGGVLTLRFELGSADDPGVAAKFDVVIEAYNFTRPDSRIALGSRVNMADGGVRAAEVGGHPAVVGDRGDDVAFLSWVQNVTVDGRDHPVGWSVHVSTSGSAMGQGQHESAIVYWSYAQGERIVHDPVLGVTQAVKDLAGQLQPFLVGLVATVAVLAVGFEVRRRVKL